MLQRIPHGRHGSLPAFVMRTGQMLPISPEDARQDLSLSHVLAVTDPRTSLPMPTGPAPSMTPLPPAQQNPTTTAVAATTTAIPPTPMPTATVAPPPASPSNRMHWHAQHRVHPMMAEIRRLHPRANLGDPASVELGEWQGRPTAKFQINASPIDAQSAAGALRRAAGVLRSGGLSSLPPELVGGPLAALMRGGAVELHFQNGVVVRTAL